MKELGDTATRWNALLAHMMKENERQNKDLLAEVERLREVNDDLICELQGFQEAVAEDEAGYKDLVASLEGIEEELKAEVERLRYHLDLMIEKFGEAYLIETLIERGEEE